MNVAKNMGKGRSAKQKTKWKNIQRKKLVRMKMATKLMNEVNPNRRKSIVIGTIDQNIEEVLGRNLDRLQFEVIFVRKCSEVLLALLEKDVDLVIIDMDVPGPLGFEVLAVIRKTRPRLPVIVISADYTYQLRKIAAEQGIIYQLMKPVASEEINLVAETVHSLLLKRAVA